MTRVRQVKTNFTAGEVSSDLLGRGDLVAYENGASKILNMFVHPTGGISRRSGLRYIDTAIGNGRLIPFEFNTEQNYLILITGNQIDVYLNDDKVGTLPSPWPENEISQLAWTQSADTLLLVHPFFKPQKLLRNKDGNFILKEWTFFQKDNISYQPFYKFVSSAITLTPSAITGTVTLTASEDVFSPQHAGTRMQINGKQADILSYDSPTVVTVNLIEDLSDTDATIDWFEQAFSEVRGYPATVAFHQDRLVVGGSRDLPNRLWFSKSGDLFNFDLGTGLDDEAIEFAILSDQVNAIRGIFSGRHLQVFTSGAEWMVTGTPLTPTSVQLNRQTRVGSVVERYIPPVTADGATIFVARDRQGIREFLYTDLEQAYSAVDLALVSRHIPVQIVDQDYDPYRRLVFVVRDDGKFATMTFYRAEQVRAWTLHETDGLVRSVTVVGDNVYLLVDRDGKVFIEKFDENITLDSALSGSGASSLVWSGLDHLEGNEVQVIADGVVLDDGYLVQSGQITLLSEASEIEVGLPYKHIIEPLPPASNNASIGRKLRLIKALFRVQDTQALRLDVGKGLQDISLKQIGETAILDAPPPKVSKDVTVNALGWQKDGTTPLWRIEQEIPYPFTLLSVGTEMKIND